MREWPHPLVPAGLGEAVALLSSCVTHSSLGTRTPPWQPLKVLPTFKWIPAPTLLGGRSCSWRVMCCQVSLQPLPLDQASWSPSPGQNSPCWGSHFTDALNNLQQQCLGWSRAQALLLFQIHKVELIVLIYLCTQGCGQLEYRTFSSCGKCNCLSFV